MALLSQLKHRELNPIPLASFGLLTYLPTDMERRLPFHNAGRMHLTIDEPYKKPTRPFLPLTEWRSLTKASEGTVEPPWRATPSAPTRCTSPAARRSLRLALAGEL